MISLWIVPALLMSTVAGPTRAAQISAKISTFDQDELQSISLPVTATLPREASDLEYNRDGEYQCQDELAPVVAGTTAWPAKRPDIIEAPAASLSNMTFAEGNLYVLHNDETESIGAQLTSPDGLFSVCNPSSELPGSLISLKNSLDNDRTEDIIFNNPVFFLDHGQDFGASLQNCQMDDMTPSQSMNVNQLPATLLINTPINNYYQYSSTNAQISSLGPVVSTSSAVPPEGIQLQEEYTGPPTSMSIVNFCPYPDERQPLLPAFSLDTVLPEKQDAAILQFDTGTYLSCQVKPRYKRNKVGKHSSARFSEVLPSCQICGAMRNTKGQFELPLEIPNGFAFDGKIQLIRSAIGRYIHHSYAELSSTSSRNLKSFTCIMKCYDEHCRGNTSEFIRRHPSWSSLCFQYWFCSGKDVCDYTAMLDKRRKHAERCGQNRKGKRKLPPQIHSHDAESGPCSRCGLSRGQRGYFVIPMDIFRSIIMLESKLQLVREMYELYNHHGFGDLEPASYVTLQSLKCILICYYQHCGGNVAEFQRRHPSFVLSSFRRLCCSGDKICNYLKKLEARKLRNGKLKNVQRKLSYDREIGRSDT